MPPREIPQYMPITTQVTLSPKKGDCKIIMTDGNILIEHKVSDYYALVFYFLTRIACNLLTMKPPSLLYSLPERSMYGTVSKGIFKALYQTELELKRGFHCNSPACRFLFLLAAEDECTHFKWRHRN